MSAGIFDRKLFSAAPIVAILRGISPELLPDIVESCLRGGISNLEITMNSQNAAAQIASACEVAGDQMNIGAGTVTSVALLEEALRAGASFIVTPTTLEPVITGCVRRNIPIFPGALSPSEIARAWGLGAAMVKIFPADRLGPGFLRSVKAPFPDIKLMPTGGVDLQTLPFFAKAGADAVGVGTPLFRPEQIAAKNWSWLAAQAASFVQSWRQIALLSRVSAS